MNSKLEAPEIGYLMALVLKEQSKFRDGGPSFLSLEAIYEKLNNMLPKTEEKSK